MENENILTLRLTRRKAVLILTVLFLAWHPGSLGSEILTMTTYYPAPYGGYASLLTTGQTLLARDGGNVGIGTSAPTVKLDVNGQLRIQGGSPGEGKVLTSDAGGLASWRTQQGNTKVYTVTSGYVSGIGAQDFCISKGYGKALLYHDYWNGNTCGGTTCCCHNNQYIGWDTTGLLGDTDNPVLRAGCVPDGGYCWYGITRYGRQRQFQVMCSN